MVLTIVFRDLQKEWRRFSSTMPKLESLTPYCSNLRMSRGIGDCKFPSHQAGARSGVRAHCLGWLGQLKGPANLFHTCPQPT